jgi:hypothetical protein
VDTHEKHERFGAPNRLDLASPTAFEDQTGYDKLPRNNRKIGPSHLPGPISRIFESSPEFRPLSREVFGRQGVRAGHSIRVQISSVRSLESPVQRTCETFRSPQTHAWKLLWVL